MTAALKETPGAGGTRRFATKHDRPFDRPIAGFSIQDWLDLASACEHEPDRASARFGEMASAADGPRRHAFAERARPDDVMAEIDRHSPHLAMSGCFPSAIGGHAAWGMHQVRKAWFPTTCGIVAVTPGLEKITWPVLPFAISLMHVFARAQIALLELDA